MKKLLLIAALLIAAHVRAESGALKPVELRCERIATPLGVDVPQPLLSWKLEANGNAKGQVQTAYEIEIASSAEKLAKGNADLWASGKVASDATFDVAYAGKALASEQACFWRVRVYDRDGKASAWSEPALWSMGLLAASDWKAQWIGFDAARTSPNTLDFGNAAWIWHAADPAGDVPVCKRWFFGALPLPDASTIEKAEIVITCDDWFALSVNGTKAAASKKVKDSWKKPLVVDVTKLLKPGSNELVIETENTTASPAGLIAKLSVKMSNGRKMELPTDASWQSATDANGPRSAAKIVAKVGAHPWGALDLSGGDATASEGKSGWGDSVWIWHAADGATPPEGVRQFRSSFAIPDGAKIKSAEVQAAVDNEAKIFVNGKDVLHCGGWHEAVHKDILKAVKSGANEIRIEGKNTGPDPAGLLLRVKVTLADGSAIQFGSTAKWESSKDGKEWAAVRVVGAPGCQPWGETKIGSSGVITPPVAYLRTSFAADKPVKRAMLYASALGIADFHLNGRRVADEWLTPGWTHYPNRVHYRAYDVTKQIQRGENALGIALGDGWFSGYVGYGHRRDHYGKKPRALAQLHVTFEDGSESIVTSGPDWKASTGPITEQDFLMGETYDARLEQLGWDAPKFDASKWQPVSVGSDEIAKPNLEWHPGPPVIAYAEVKPIEITEPVAGTYVFNLGQNFAGIERLKIRGEAGQKITIRIAERLNPDGTAYTENYRSARSIDTYICKGGGEEVWTPRFTFHGFQYVQVEGLNAKPSPDLITGLPLGSDTPTAGEFACSDPMLNKLGSNTWWTQRSNFIDIPTDCPQRDERLGWTGDAQMYIRAASLHADVESFFQKWLYDLQDSQMADGQFTMVAPPLVATGGGGPAWIDAGSVCPWTMYDVYGDKRALERMYPNMKRLVASYKDRCSPELKAPAKFHCFGDWLNINANTPNDVIFSAYFALTTKLAAQAAEVLGKNDDAAEYRKLCDQIKAAFNRDYVDTEGHVKGQTQTAYVLALQFDLLDEAKRAAAEKLLIADIEKHDWHLTTGFVGTKDLMLVLTKIGRTDVAYRLLHNDTFPSWGFSIKNGATTIWERWNGWTPEKGFGDAGMNSFAHYAFGAVYQWMVENIGGIRSAAPAFKRIVIAPTPDDKLAWARTSYDSINGRIASSWKKENGALHLDVEIPPNTTAGIRVPATNAAAVKADTAAKFIRAENGVAIYEVGSGNYSFDVK